MGSGLGIIVVFGVLGIVGFFLWFGCYDDASEGSGLGGCRGSGFWCLWLRELGDLMFPEG